MRAADAVLVASVRAYRARRWDVFEQLRDRELVGGDQRTRLTRALATMQQLRRSAQAVRPAWPTEADRAEDLEAHRRLSATLARTAGYRPTTNRRPRAKSPR